MHWLGLNRKEGGRADQTNPPRNIKLVPGSTVKESLDSLGTFRFNIKLVPGSTVKESLDPLGTFRFNIKLVPGSTVKESLDPLGTFRFNIKLVPSSTDKESLDSLGTFPAVQNIPLGPEEVPRQRPSDGGERDAADDFQRVLLPYLRSLQRHLQVPGP